MSIEGQGHIFSIYFPGFLCFVLYLAKISGERLQDQFTGPLVLWFLMSLCALPSMLRLLCSIVSSSGQCPGPDPEMLLPGGGALKAEVLNRAAKAAKRGGGESMRRVLNPPSLWGQGASPGKFCKIYVSENAFQAILKPIFPYSITSILSKVRHSNTFDLLLTFHFLVILLVLW